MNHQQPMTPDEREQAAQAEDKRAAHVRDMATAARGTANKTDDQVVRSCMNRAAAAFDDLAVYHAGRAAGFRQ